MKTLRLILGDQLNPKHSWFKNVDEEIIYVLMEVKQETNTSAPPTTLKDFEDFYRACHIQVR